MCWTLTKKVCQKWSLGHNYADVVKDILARVSLYLLSSPAPSFASLIKPLLTSQSIPNTLIVILLDWSQPWSWMRQLREWLLLLRSVILSLSPECKESMEEVISSWRERGRTGGSVNLDGTGAVATEGDVALPLGPGEWEDALGLPLCVVCQNVRRSVTYFHCAALIMLLVGKDRLPRKNPGLERRKIRSSPPIFENSSFTA